MNANVGSPTGSSKPTISLVLDPSPKVAEPTAREKALASSELISEVFSHLEKSILDGKTDKDYEELKETRQSLYSLALTARPFLRPAVEILWRNLDSMGPLLNLLPFIRSTQNAGSLVELSLESPSDDFSWASWKQFDHYATFVRVMRLHAQSNRRYHIISEAYMYTILPKLRPDPLFLPNLQALIIDQLPIPAIASTELLIQLPLILLSPSVVTFEISVAVLQSINLNGSFMAALNIQSPRLNRLHFTQCNQTAKPPINIIKTVHHLHILGQDVDLDQRLLQAMGQANITTLVLSSLSQVVTTITSTLGGSLVNWKLFPGERGKGLFGELERVALDGPLDQVHNFIGYISSPYLRKVSLNIHIPGSANISSLMQSNTVSPGQFIQFVSDIMGNWPNLQWLEIKFPGAVGYTSIQDPKACDLLFQCFTNKKHLQTLRFVDFPGLLHGISDYTHLKDVLPNLESLRLPAQEKGLQIEELRDIVAAAPKLKDLAISLDFTTAENRSDRDDPSSVPHNFLKHKLKSLEILSDCPADSFIPARQLDDIFRHLVELKGMGNGWDKVHELLRLCQRARR